MKNKQQIIFLFVTLCILGALATWDEWQTEKDTKLKAEKNKIAKVDLVSADRIEFEETIKPFNVEENERKLKIVVKKSDGGWKLTRPLAFAGDDASIDQLISDLNSYQYSKIVTSDPARFKEFGLEEGSGRVLRFFSGEDLVLDLHIGKNAPVGYSVYFKISSKDDVYLGGQQLNLATSKDLIDFREKSLTTLLGISEKNKFNLSLDSKKSFEIISRTKEAELDQASVEYQLIGPEGKSWPASTYKISDYLRKLDEITAEEFVDLAIDGAAFELLSDMKPEFQVVVNDLSLDFLKKDDQYAVRLRESSSFALFPKNKVEEIKVSIEDLIDKKVMSGRDLTWNKIELDAVLYEKDKEGKWNSRNQQGVDEIEEILTDIEFLEGTQVMPLDMVDKGLFEEPEAVLKLFTKDSPSQPIKLEIFKDPDGPNHKFVRGASEAYVYLCKTSDLHFLQQMRDIATKQDSKAEPKKAG